MSLKHQIFWNIPIGALLLYSLTALAFAILVFSLYRRARLWAWGTGKEPPLGSWWKRSLLFTKTLLLDLALHQRFFQDLYPGLIHFFLFTGFFLLFLGTVAGFIDHYFFPFLKDQVYLVSSFILDLAGFIMLLGVALAAFRRYIQRPARLDNKPEDSLALLWLTLMAFSGYLVEGARLATPEPGANLSQAARGWMPGGALASWLFLPLSQESREAWHRWLWWAHSGLGLVALAYFALSYNRLLHILVSTANVYLRPLGPKGTLQAVDLESAQKIGVGDVRDFSWKHLLELDACTRCGRCQDSCPAHLSSKALNPKKVVQDLKAHWLDRAKRSNSKGQEGNQALIPEVIQEQALWDCTTCLACQERCPVFIQPMYKIMEMRRYQAMMLGQLPPSAQVALQNMQKRGHPWSGSQYLRLREDWTKEVPVTKIDKEIKIKTLFFVGCTGALVERNVAVTLSLARLLNRAGVEFGVLGGVEACCGDPARRMGYELLFQSLAQENIASFQKHGIQQIITTCPHCYHTFKNEYPRLGGNFSVLHHSEFLASLLQKQIIKGVKRDAIPLEQENPLSPLKKGVERGKASLEQDISPSPSKERGMKVRCADSDFIGGVRLYTYHDACYLSRYNGLISAPRHALELALGGKPREMALSRGKSFCCGGGGGHAWMEEVGGKRINEIRLEQALSTGAQAVVTSCPYCLQMLENAVERKAALSNDSISSNKEELKILDIAEIIEQAIPL